MMLADSKRGFTEIEQHIEYDESGKPVGIVSFRWDGKGQGEQ